MKNQENTPKSLSKYFIHY